MSPSGCYHLHPPRSSSLMTYLLRVWARRDGRTSPSMGESGDWRFHHRTRQSAKRARLLAAICG